MCLPHRCIATSAALTTENIALLLLPAFASAVMCSPSRCLAINYSGFQASCDSNVLLYYSPESYPYNFLSLQCVRVGIHI
jgi:hypothetical protein